MFHKTFAGFGIPSVLNTLPSFLLFTFIYPSNTYQMPGILQEGIFTADGELDQVSLSLQSLDNKKNSQNSSYPLLSPTLPHDFLSIHLFIHLLTPKISVCFVEILHFGAVLRSTMKKRKNACPAPHSFWNPRRNPRDAPAMHLFSSFLDVGFLY